MQFADCLQLFTKQTTVFSENGSSLMGSNSFLLEQTDFQVISTELPSPESLSIPLNMISSRLVV